MGRRRAGTPWVRRPPPECDGNSDGNPGLRTRSSLNRDVQLTSATAHLTRDPLHLECKSALAGQADLRDGRERGTPPTSPTGYHTPSRGQSCAVRPPIASRAAPGPTRGRAAPDRRDAAPAWVRFGGANPERTAHERPSQPGTRRHVRPGHKAYAGTGQHRLSACFQVSGRRGHCRSWRPMLCFAGRCAPANQEAALRRWASRSATQSLAVRAAPIRVAEAVPVQSP